MEIILKRLSLQNFKGIKSLTVDFNDHLTNVFGRNGSGKTTLFDAFAWLLFAKDSSDRADFEIKPLSVEGIRSQKMDNEVEAELTIDGRVMTLKRVNRERWVKKRGESEAKFDGNEKVHYVNDVPVSETDYRVKIAGIVEEKLFKMITNPLYFNSLKWQDRREVLMQMAGSISDLEILDMLRTEDNYSEWSPIADSIANDEKIDDLKKKIAAKRKKAVEEIKFIPTRIDELTRGLKDPENWAEIESQIKTLQGQITDIEDSLTSHVRASSIANEARSAKNKELQNLLREIRNNEDIIRNKFRDRNQNRVNTISSLERKVTSVKYEIKDLTSNIETSEQKVKTLNDRLVKLRADWSKVDAEQITFNAHEFSCPTCKREFEESTIEQKKVEMLKNFNTSKSNRLASLSADGKQIRAEVEGINQRIATNRANLETLQSDLKNLETELATLRAAHQDAVINEEVQVEALLGDDAILHEMRNTATALKLQLENDESASSGDIEVLRNRRAEINTQIDQLKKVLAGREERQRAATRIAELEGEEKDLAALISGYERTEYLISLFEKAKVDTMQDRINHKFSVVTFKMFNTLVNGGVEPCCDCLVDGVPFSDANTASKINAGIDVINALCDHYGTHAPIFIDGRESVTDIIETNSQVINLIVSAKDKKLRIVSPAEMATA